MRRPSLATFFILLLATACIVLLQTASGVLGGDHVPGARNTEDIYSVSIQRSIKGPLDSRDVPLPLAEAALDGHTWFGTTSSIVSIATPSGPGKANVAYVHGNLFEALDVPIVIGAYCADPRGVVLSHDFHQRVFAGQDDVVGKMVEAKGRSMEPGSVPLRVCGVAARGFRGVRIGRPTDLWIPWAGWRDLLFPRSEPESEVARFFPVELYARLVTEQDRRALIERLEAAGARSGEWRAGEAKVSLQGGIALDAARSAQWGERTRSYFVLSALLLLVSSGALLAQVILGSIRAVRDESTRVALGEAAGFRFVRHCCAALRTVVPPVAVGGAVGFFLMFPLMRTLDSAGVRWVAQLFDPAAGAWRAAAIALTVAAASAAAVVLLTLVLSAPGRDKGQSLRSHSRRYGFIVVPLSLLLVGAASVGALAGASLLGSAAELGNTLDGVDAQAHFVSVELTSQAGAMRLLSRRPVDGLVSRLQQVDPQIALASSPPIGHPETTDLFSGGFRMAVFANHVTPTYFGLLGIELQGRTPAIGTHEAVVSRRFADRYLGATDPIGRTIKVADPMGSARTVQVVGVADDVHRLSPRESTAPILYLPVSEERHFSYGLSAERSAAALHATLSAENPTPFVRVTPPRSLQSLVDQEFAAERLEAWILAAVGLGLLLLALHGAYATVRTMMLERAADTAVRRALGGTPLKIAMATMGRSGPLLMPVALLGAVLAGWVAWLVHPEHGQALAFAIGSVAMLLVVLCSGAGVALGLGPRLELHLVQSLKRDA